MLRPPFAAEPGNAGLALLAAWRDALVEQLEDDATLAEDAGISTEELLAGQTALLAELRVLNRVIGDDRLPEWIAALAR